MATQHNFSLMMLYDGRWVFNPEAVYQYLCENGFGRLPIQADGKIYLVRVEDNIAYDVDVGSVSDICIKKIEKDIQEAPADEMDRRNIDTRSLRGSGIIHKKPFQTDLKEIKPSEVIDLSNKGFFFFRNGVVEVTDKEIKLVKYSDFDFKGRIIYERSLIDFEIDLSKKDSFKTSEWSKFCANAVRDVDSLQRNYGYLLHKFKFPHLSKMIVFTDADKGDGIADGGNGKSLLMKSLKHMRGLTYIDGKNFNTESQFKYQTYKDGDSILLIDDISKGFKITSLYNTVSGGIEIERKHLTPIIIEAERSPKLAITSNYGLRIDGASDKRRVTTTLFTHYYDDEKTPYSVHKEIFFSRDEWEGWNDFYLWGINCLQQYLIHGMKDDGSGVAARSAVYSEYSEDIILTVEEFIEKGIVPVSEVFEVLSDNKYFNKKTMLKNVRRIAKTVFGVDVDSTSRRDVGCIQRFYEFSKGGKSLAKDEDPF